MDCVQILSTNILRGTLAVESSLRCGRNVHCDMCSSVAVQNGEMGCMSFFAVKSICHALCSLGKKLSFLFLTLSQAFSVKTPYLLHALPYQTT